LNPTRDRQSDINALSSDAIYPLNETSNTYTKGWRYVAEIEIQLLLVGMMGYEAATGNKEKVLMFPVTATSSSSSARIRLFIDLKIAVFWVVAPCSLVEVYQRFRGPCCLHHQGDE
jgi:hypothetical protein